MRFDESTILLIEDNQAAADYHRWSINHLRRMNVAQINRLFPEQLKQAIEKVPDEEQNHFEFKHRRGDGSIRGVEVCSRKIVTGCRKLKNRTKTTGKGSLTVKVRECCSLRMKGRTSDLPKKSSRTRVIQYLPKNR